MLSGENIFNLHILYVVAEGKFICDLSKDGKIIDAVVLLLCCYFAYNFDYVIQRNLLVFFQSTMLSINSVKTPVSNPAYQYAPIGIIFIYLVLSTISVGCSCLE